uniref:BY PROTMAP: gi/647395699/emb/CDR37332.1/ RHTO0S02e13564g1_1 [Rhodosporidium toruloides] n=1 Tax=Rhodotorula toruloides TaxID=5286 RepID=A0A0K3CDR7_RHOTO
MGIDRALFAKGKVPEYLICPCCKDVLENPYEICDEAHLVCGECALELYPDPEEDNKEEEEEEEAEPPKKRARTLAETAPGLEQEFASQVHAGERDESGTPAPADGAERDGEEEEENGGGTGSEGDGEDDELHDNGDQEGAEGREGDGKGSSVCPVCQEPLLAETEVQKARAIRRIIQELTVNCAYLSFGCLWTGILREQPEHDKTCEYRPLPCVHADQGCGFSGPKDTHAKHEERDCLFATVSCPRKNCERFSGTRNDLKAYEDECDAFECETPGCPTMTTKRMMPIHQLACTEYTKLYKKAMRNIKKLKNDLEKATPSAPSKRSAEVYIKTESPLKRSRVNGRENDDEQMQDGSQPAQDAAAAAGAGADGEEEDLRPL